METVAFLETMRHNVILKACKVFDWDITLKSNKVQITVLNCAGSWYFECNKELKKHDIK